MLLHNQASPALCCLLASLASMLSHQTLAPARVCLAAARGCAGTAYGQHTVHSLPPRLLQGGRTQLCACVKAAHRLLLVDVLRPERDQGVGLAHNFRLLQSPRLHNLHHQQAFMPVQAASGMRSRLGPRVEGGRLCAAADSSRVRADTFDRVRGVAVPQLQSCTALLTSRGWDGSRTAQAPAGLGCTAASVQRVRGEQVHGMQPWHMPGSQGQARASDLSSSLDTPRTDQHGPSA